MQDQEQENSFCPAQTEAVAAGADEKKNAIITLNQKGLPDFFMKMFCGALCLLAVLTVHHICYFLYANIFNRMGLSYHAMVTALLISAGYVFFCRERKKRILLGGIMLILSVFLFVVLELSGVLRSLLYSISSGH